MEIEVQRIWPTDECCIGMVLIDGRSICYSLEDPVREVPALSVGQWKIPGKTAIPRGRYQVVIDFSQRFQKKTLHILDVPGFTGIRIHGGNTAADVEGCLIFGEKRYSDTEIGDCAPAIEAVMSEAEQAIANHESIYITIT